MRYNKKKFVKVEDGFLWESQPVWIKNSVEGKGPREEFSWKLLNENKITYDNPCPEGYIGCKLSSVFKNKENAYWSN